MLYLVTYLPLYSPRVLARANVPLPSPHPHYGTFCSPFDDVGEKKGNNSRRQQISPNPATIVKIVDIQNKLKLLKQFIIISPFLAPENKSTSRGGGAFKHNVTGLVATITAVKRKHLTQLPVFVALTFPRA